MIVYRMRIRKVELIFHCIEVAILIISNTVTSRKIAVLEGNALAQVEKVINDIYTIVQIVLEIFQKFEYHLQSINKTFYIYKFNKQKFL